MMVEVVAMAEVIDDAEDCAEDCTCVDSVR